MKNGLDPFALHPLGQPHGFLGYHGLTAWVYWLSQWLTIGLGSIATQDLMQRSMSAKNEATSVYGSYFAAILYFVFGVMSPLIGILVYSINPSLGEEDVERLMLYASHNYLPLWLNVLFVAAMTSALMSTSDSSILAGASVVTENVMPKFYKGITEQNKLLWTRIMVLVIGLGCVGIAAMIGETYELAMIAWSILLVGMFVPFAFGMYWRKANAVGGLAAALGGFGSWLVIALLLYPATRAVNGDDFNGAVWDAAYIASVPALLCSVCGMIVGSLLTQKSHPPMPLTDVNGQPLAMKNRLGWMPISQVFWDPPPVVEQALHPHTKIDPVN